MTRGKRRRTVSARAKARGNREAEFIWSTIGKTLVSSQELDVVLSQVIQVLNERVRVETGSILLRDPATNEIVFAKILHGDTEEFASVRLKVGQGIVGSVVETGKSIIVNDVRKDPRWYRNVDKESGFTTRSILCVPLIAKDEVIGAIELLNKQGGDFDASDQQLLESIAAPVAIAVQNARLHQRVLDQLTALTKLFFRVENAKREWETTADALDEGILLSDEHGRILRANNTLANWLHTMPVNLTGQLCYSVIHLSDTPPSLCPHAQLLAHRNHLQVNELNELEEPNLGGVFRVTCYPLPDQVGVPKAIVTVFKNVTEEKRMQAQLIQSEKMAATGRLAASLAHEINNPLQAIKGSLYLAQTDTGNTEKQLEHLSIANAELDRLTSLVQRVLGFSRSTRQLPARVNIPKLLDDTLLLCSRHIETAQVQAETSWETPVPEVQAMANQLTQVFLNLIINAVEAMPNGGILKVEGRTIEDDGSWLRIDIIDSGTGIETENLERIFDPFFTTKGNGIGLGLGISRTIVNNHGGKLTVSSTPGKGSVFSVWLPVTLDSSTLGEE